ncbi:VOC family protein [Flavitalea sp. BT771]|uniref:VOC family protein n=1 Tax=Flavitalea sp. BT771 TaxID=3063329 RepID=UPI0026E42343|nr:VOC family protein [Flavitalea sp. BT771]MDO6431687.1 VOC family protein [Flavitalea sp. BT771]MDV6220595.1 VOC family protein [Flavitalea sp. BT771]
MKNAVNWFEIYTSDFERAKKFYSEVFKYKLTDIPVDSERHSQMKYATFPNDQNGEGASGALVKLDVAKPGIGGTLVYFDSEEIDAELGRVETAGGKIIRPKLNIGDFGYIALIEDTEGNLIGLHSPLPPR